MMSRILPSGNGNDMTNAGSEQNAVALVRPHDKPLTANDTKTFIRLLKIGMKKIEVNSLNKAQTVTVNSPNVKGTPASGSRTKGEFEVLANLFTTIPMYTFRDVFTFSIETLCQKADERNQFPFMAANLLKNPATSAVFSEILLTFLLRKMPVMGEDAKKGRFYLLLFKLLLNSTSVIFPQQNLPILLPHLNQIVTNCFDLSMNSTSPYYYVQLLGVLLKSIGQNHYLLFLPLLPSLLQRINRLLSSSQRKVVKNLFVELSLSLPIRIDGNSLRPYVPQLMNPIVAALNGSPTLRNQGLRILEVFVNNLDPNFFYESNQPVREELKKSLWTILQNLGDNTTAATAFRILSKMCRTHRYNLSESQNLSAYCDDDETGPFINLKFPNTSTPVRLPLEKVIDFAVGLLKSKATNVYDLRQSWQFLKIFVLYSIEFDPAPVILKKLMLYPNVGKSPMIRRNAIRVTDGKARQILVKAFSGWLVAIGIQQIRKEVHCLLFPLLRHIAMAATVKQTCTGSMDPLFPFDSMASILAAETVNRKNSVLLSISVMIQFVIIIMGSKDEACSLPVVEYMTDTFLKLCYDGGCYTKMASCQVIRFLLDNLSTRWALEHQDSILRAMYFIIGDVSNDISARTIEVAKQSTAKMIKISALYLDSSFSTLQGVCMHSLIQRLILQLTSPSSNIRQESMKALNHLAMLQGITVSALIEPYKSLLVTLVGSCKKPIQNQPVINQLGFLEGLLFCLNLEPNLITLVPNAPMQNIPVEEMLSLCETDDAGLKILNEYRKVTSLTPVKIAYMKVLAYLGIMTSNPERLVGVFLKAMSSTDRNIQKCGYECFKQFSKEYQFDFEAQSATVRPVLEAVANIETATQSSILELSYMYQLFPAAIDSDKIWGHLLHILRKCLGTAVKAYQTPETMDGKRELGIAVEVLNMYTLMTDTDSMLLLLEPLIKLCLVGEKSLALAEWSPLRPPLMAFLLKVPQDYINLTFSTTYIMTSEWRDFLIHFIQLPKATNLRKCLESDTRRLLNFLTIKKISYRKQEAPETGGGSENVIVTLQLSEQLEIQFFIVKILSILCEFNKSWIFENNGSNRNEVIQALQTLWQSSQPQSSRFSEAQNGRMLHPADADLSVSTSHSEVEAVDAIGKRCSFNLKLQTLLLKLVTLISEDETIKAIEGPKVEVASMSGPKLSCPLPPIQETFSKLFVKNVEKNLCQRLLCIIRNPNWHTMDAPFWIKQCEKIVLDAVEDAPLEILPKGSTVLPVATCYYQSDQQTQQEFVQSSANALSSDLTDSERENVPSLENDLETLQNLDDTDINQSRVNSLIFKIEEAFVKTGFNEPTNPELNLRFIVNKELEFIKKARTGYSVLSLTQPLVHLCSMDTSLAAHIWISFFPKAWEVLSKPDQLLLGNEVVRFLKHNSQQSRSPSALSTFVEGFIRCRPLPYCEPEVLSFLEAFHNMWNTTARNLDNQAEAYAASNARR